MDFFKTEKTLVLLSEAGQTLLQDRHPLTPAKKGVVMGMGIVMYLFSFISDRKKIRRKYKRKSPSFLRKEVEKLSQFNSIFQIFSVFPGLSLLTLSFKV